MKLIIDVKSFGTKKPSQWATFTEFISIQTPNMVMQRITEQLLKQVLRELEFQSEKKGHSQKPLIRAHPKKIISLQKSFLPWGKSNWGFTNFFYTTPHASSD